MKRKLQIILNKIYSNPLIEQNWINLSEIINDLKIENYSFDIIPVNDSFIGFNNINKFKIDEFKKAALEIQAFDLVAILRELETSNENNFNTITCKLKEKEKGIDLYLPENKLLMYFISNLLNKKLPQYKELFKYKMENSNIVEYIGVDIGGSKNTWLCSLVKIQDKLTFKFIPNEVSLADIVSYVNNANIISVAIDAQLTWSIYGYENDNGINDGDPIDTGFRLSEKMLKDEIVKYDKEFIFNISSQNSLMAVPIRGRQLAQYLRVRIPSVIETHPTINLIKILHNNKDVDYNKLIKTYKKKGNGKEDKSNYNNANKIIFDIVCDKYKIEKGDFENHINYSDGLIDSLICAITSYLLINQSHELRNLTIENDVNMIDIRGYAPFYVFK